MADDERKANERAELARMHAGHRHENLVETYRRLYGLTGEDRAKVLGWLRAGKTPDQAAPLIDAHVAAYEANLRRAYAGHDAADAARAERQTTFGGAAQPPAQPPPFARHRKATVFMPCAKHAGRMAGLARQERAKAMIEGGFAGDPPCACRMKPGVDLFTSEFVAANANGCGVQGRLD